MQRENPLFSSGDLSSVLENQSRAATKAADALSAAQIQAGDDEQLVGALQDQFDIDPLTVYPDRAEKTMAECQFETRDRFTYNLREGQSIKVPGVSVTVKLPFTGELKLLQYRPSAFMFKDAYADITKPVKDGIGWLTFHFEFNQHGATPEQIQQEINSALEFTSSTIKNQRSQIEKFRTDVQQALFQAIARRRASLGSIHTLSKALEIPVTQNAGMPSLTPIAVAKKVLRQLPPVADAKQAAGFSVTAEAYSNILAAIRSQGRTFEKTPATFAKFGEEELRDIILANLNTHFHGQATGETFRAKGKTDICIEQDNRAAFVGELKIWRGASELEAGLLQLLNYLTWRDCKAALVVFNRDRSKFSEVIEKAPEALRRLTALYSGETKQNEPGEWQMTFRAPGDDGRNIIVQLMLYNLFA